MTEQEYFENTIQELYDKYPSISTSHKPFLMAILKYGSGNKIKQLPPDDKEYVNKDKAAAYIKDIVAATGIERRYVRRPHRLYILEELLGKKETAWLAEKDELVNRDVVYEHNKSEKPSSAQVLNLISSQEKTIIQQVIQLLPKLTEKEWNVIDAYRAAL